MPCVLHICHNYETQVLSGSKHSFSSQEALSACDAALAARGHATNIVVHYSDDPATVASAIGAFVP